MTRTVIVNGQSLFIANGNGSVVTKYDNGNSQSGPSPYGGLGMVINNSGQAYSLSPAGDSLSRFASNGTLLQVATPATLTGGKALAIDGLSDEWIVNADGTVATVPGNVSLTINPVGIAKAGNIVGPTGILVDASGSVWISNAGNNTATEIIGSAFAIETPVVAGVVSGLPSNRP